LLKASKEEKTKEKMPKLIESKMLHRDR